MGGLFGAATEQSCVMDLFFGVDYHSHLGTKRGGMAVVENGFFQRSIHNIENSPFRTKFENDVAGMRGTIGIGCISDGEAQPLIVRSHHGSYAVATVGRINNLDALANELFREGNTQFLEMSGGEINQTELFAALINRAPTLVEGIRYAQSRVDGSMSALILTPECIYAARDLMGRTPLVIGRRKDAHSVSFESFAFLNLGYEPYRELGPGEIVRIDAKRAETVMAPEENMKICAFLWVYYGYPTSSYEGVNVESMRYRCGEALARRDNIAAGNAVVPLGPDTKCATEVANGDGALPCRNVLGADLVAGVPDSGTAHAVGYANATDGLPFARPFIKYTPTWPRSFMPQQQEMRNLIAHMKLIAVENLIRGRSIVLIDDSIVRGTQLRETSDFLYSAGARELHIRPACPPIMYGCRYLNFSRSTSAMDLITRRVIAALEGVDVPDEATVAAYVDPDGEKYAAMVDEIRRRLGCKTLVYNRLDDMLAAIGIDPSRVCTYCWSGKE